MSDDALRALERAVAAGGSPADRLALARALERCGRGDEVLEVLWPAAADPAVRAELARRPAWTHQPWNHSSSRYLDVAPLDGPPRVAWWAPLPGGDSHEPCSQQSNDLFASPLGIVVHRRGTVELLDPSTGESRWEYEVDLDSHFQVSLSNECLILDTQTQVLGLALLDGTVLFRQAPIREAFNVIADDRWIALGREGTLCYALTKEGRGELLWHAEYPRPELGERRLALGDLERPALSGDLCIVGGHLYGRTFLDVRTGARVGWRPWSYTLVADCHGVLDKGAEAHGEPSEAGHLQASDARGETRWTRPDRPRDHYALSPEVILCVDGLRLLARSDGSEIAVLRPEPPPFMIGDIALVRGGLYMSWQVDGETGKTLSFDTSGRRIWSIDGFASRILPLDRRLYVESGGRIVCLVGDGRR